MTDINKNSIPEKPKSSQTFKKLRVPPTVNAHDFQKKTLDEVKTTTIHDTSNMSQDEIDALVDFINTHEPCIHPPIMTQEEIDLLLDFIREQGIEPGNHVFTDDEIDELNYRRFTKDT
jgi:hypothetical protein